MLKWKDSSKEHKTVSDNIRFSTKYFYILDNETLISTQNCHVQALVPQQHRAPHD